MDTACPVTIRITEADFDVSAETALLCAGRHDVGAVVAFTGLCRDEGNTLETLELEHYPGMAEAEVARVAAQACARWPLLGLTVIHRYGHIAPGAHIVLVIAASSHRAAAFNSADFVMDFLKSRAPFWKKQHSRDGSAGGWVDARESDVATLTRWEGNQPGPLPSSGQGL